MAQMGGNVTIRYNISRFKKYLAKLREDVYEQPPDPGHTSWAIDALKERLPENIQTVLDMGCGQGFMKPFFERGGLVWEGVTLGEDYRVCKELGMTVHEADVSFLPFANNSYDLIFARHILEHSPCPIPTLMEWKRVSRKYLILVSPAPDYWSYRGQNHYSVAPKEQLEWWLERSGWKCIRKSVFDNHNKLFLKPWRRELAKLGHIKGVKVMTHMPEERLDVEYRFLCETGEEVRT